MHTIWPFPDYAPDYIRPFPTILRYGELLGPLDWSHFPERNLVRNWGQSSIPYAALIVTELIRLNAPYTSMSAAQRCLLEHPGFIPLLGFPLPFDPAEPLGFNPRASLPTRPHLNYMLRTMPQSAAQFLLADSVQLILAELLSRQVASPDCISLDTKHILAWVKENNPKAYVADRFNKNKQPLNPSREFVIL